MALSQILVICSLIVISTSLEYEANSGDNALESSRELEWSICHRDEHWSMCNAHCQKNCTNFDKPMVCPLMCVPGCVCNPGLIRGPNGQCIRRTECTVSLQDVTLEISRTPVCREQEHWSPCNAHCQKNCTNYDKPLICPRLCIPGCVCDEGLVRSSDGRCISVDKCDETDESLENSVCRVGERWDRCNAHCQRNCTNFDKPLICPKICLPGCICEDGLVRGPDGKCIPSTECPDSIETQRTEDVESLSGGCPDRKACKAMCQSIGKKYGVCTGFGSKICMCLVPQRTI